ncbi:heterokaryon incompatibility protein-domain-containing protein [Nemania sp. FL0031]|nr:heterokaryon incompatibility protein-domain-containing protein [Nemania sp. FL0031]
MGDVREHDRNHLVGKRSFSSITSDQQYAMKPSTSPATTGDTRKRVREALPDCQAPKLISNLLPEGHKSEGICEDCAKLDLQGLVQKATQLGQYGPLSRSTRDWCDLHVADAGYRYRTPKETSCNLCRMLMASRVDLKEGVLLDDSRGDEIRATSFLRRYSLERNSEIREENKYICLIEGSLGIPYVTLSYVWGDVQAPDGNACNMNGKKLQPENLTAVIKDSITVTRALGYRFLWVDKFCIDQDNPDERHRQIQQMNAIYQNSDLTIIAAAGKDENYGLSGVGFNMRSPQLTAKAQDKLHIKTKSKTYEYLRNGIFGRIQQKEFGKLVLDKLSTRDTFYQYLSNVYAYSSRNLRYDEDALKAFQGLIQHFSNRKESLGNIWGLAYPRSNTQERESYLIQALSWSHAKARSKLRRRQNFPTWTWVGWDGPVWFPFPISQNSTFQSRVKDLRFESPEGNIIGLWDLRRSWKIFVLENLGALFPDFSILRQ